MLETFLPIFIVVTFGQVIPLLSIVVKLSGRLMVVIFFPRSESDFIVISVDAKFTVCSFLK